MSCWCGGNPPQRAHRVDLHEHASAVSPGFALKIRTTEALERLASVLEGFALGEHPIRVEAVIEDFGPEATRVILEAGAGLEPEVIG